MKMVFSHIIYLYVKNLHDTGRMSDEEYNAITAHAGQQQQSKAENEEEAIYKIKQLYKTSEITFSSDDFCCVEFDVLQP